MTNHVCKQYASISTIISRLKAKGIEVDDQHAKDLFSFKNYYRFIPYIKNSTSSPIAINEKSLRCLENRYRFDKKLRNILSESTESIENFARNDITEYFGGQRKNFYTDFLNPNQDDIENFDNNTLIFKLNKVFDESAFEGIVHYKKKYGSSLETIPIWVLVETLEFGTTIWFLETICKYEKEIRNRHFYNAINKKYDITLAEYITCLKSSKSLRNLCAHGNRLYKNSLNGHKPKFPEKWNISDSSAKTLNSNNTSGLFRKLIGFKAFYKNRRIVWNEFVDSIDQHFEANKGIVSIHDYEIPVDWIEILKKW